MAMVVVQDNFNNSFAFLCENKMLKEPNLYKINLYNFSTLRNLQSCLIFFPSHEIKKLKLKARTKELYKLLWNHYNIKLSLYRYIRQLLLQNSRKILELHH